MCKIRFVDSEWEGQPADDPTRAVKLPADLIHRAFTERFQKKVTARAGTWVHLEVGACDESGDGAKFFHTPSIPMRYQSTANKAVCVSGGLASCLQFLGAGDAAETYAAQRLSLLRRLILIA